MGIYINEQDSHPAVVSVKRSMFDAKLVDFPNSVVSRASFPKLEETMWRAPSIWLKANGGASKSRPASSAIGESLAADPRAAHIPAPPPPSEGRPIA